MYDPSLLITVRNTRSEVCIWGGKTNSLRESFLGFIQITHKDAESFVVDIIEKDEIVLKDYCLSAMTTLL